MSVRIAKLFRAARSRLALAPIRPKNWRSSYRAAKILCFSYGHFESVRAGKPVDAAGLPIPWYTYPAIDFLRQLDLSEKTVFEYGSGNSTLFWAARAARVISVEDDEHWSERLKDIVPDNCTILQEADLHRYAHVIDSYPEGFDIIVVDGPARGRTRLRCARAALKHLKVGGMIILDNSDWLPDSARLLRQADLLQVDMSGFIPIGDHTQTTSFFFHRESRFATTGTRQPAPCVGALGWDWETVTPTDGASLEWEGERIYGVVRHEVMDKATPDGTRTFEIAFFDPHRPPPKTRLAMLYDRSTARILWGPYVVEPTTDAVDAEVDRLRAMSWETFREFARKPDRRRYLLD
jgi:hypothetical protein